MAGLLRVAPQRLLDLRSVDRLVRGRVAIGLVAFALIGIVTLQLGLLKLNSGIGRTLGREQVLQRENSLLGIENSELAAGNRIQSRATELGMEIVPTGALRFLSAHTGDPARAVAALTSPERTAAAQAREAEAAIARTAHSSEGSASSPEAAPTSATPSETPAGTSAGVAPAAATSEASSGGGESATAATSATGASPAAAQATGASVGESAASGPGGGTQASPAG